MTGSSTSMLPRPPAHPLVVHRRTGDRVRPDSATPDLHTAAVGKALAFMREHLPEAQGLSDHARAASLSPYHFHRVFKSVTGVTPGRFLTSLRLAEAKRLLLYSSMSAGCIGQFVGYLSPGTFTTQFTRLVGLPPRRFRLAGRDLGGVSVTEVLAADARDGAHLPGHLTVKVGPRPDDGTGYVAIAGFRTAVPQEQPTGCAAAMAGDTIAFAGAESARYLFAFSLPRNGTVRQVLTASSDTPGLYVARADLHSAALVDAHDVELTLHRLSVFDPPMLTAVPLLWRRPC